VKTEFPRLIPLLVLIIIPILVGGILSTSTANLTWQHILYYYPYTILRNITDAPTLDTYDRSIPEYQTISYYPYSLVVLHFQGKFVCTESLNMSSSFCGNHKKITNALISDTYRVGIVFPIPFLGLCLLFGFYPLKYHAKDYFRKKGDRYAIGEYTFVKNILYIGIPLMVFFGSIYYILSTLDLIHNILYSVVYFSQVSLQYSVTAGSLWMLSLLIKKDFRYYLAKAYIKIIPDSDENTKKINLLMKAVKSYNKYLLRILQLQINTLKFYSSLVVKSNVLIDENMKSISESFDDTDKLMPARRMSQITNVQKTEEIFASQSLGTRIITWGTLIGTILPVAISIFQLFIQPGKH
jgi:hypothetical protein